MKKVNLITLAVVSSLLSTSVFSGVLMVRQEHLSDPFKPEQKNATLIKAGGSAGKTFFGVQAVHKGETLSTYALSSSEVQLGYRYDVNDTIRLIPQIQATATASGIGWKPQLGFVYKFGGGFSTELKYKHEYFVRQTPNSKGESTSEKSQYQVNLNYSLDKLRLGLQYDYHKGLDGQKYYNGNEFKQELELKAYYKIAKGWTPFMTLAGVPVHHSSEDYQLRTRLGFLYSF